MANFGLICDRTLVYLEGDASMRSYEAADGQKHSSLNILQRKISFPGVSLSITQKSGTDMHLDPGNLEVLKRPASTNDQ